MTHDELESLELDLLFEALHRCYGYDFKNYARDSTMRRVHNRVTEEQLESISHLQHMVLHDQRAADSLVRALSINVSEMFRDPAFYQSFRQNVLPLLTAYDHFKIWHAGCATGQEPYSMAILLSEEGIYDRSRLYATDFNSVALDTAKTGIYPLSAMQTYSANYHAAGGTNPFSDYYHANYDAAALDPKLRKNVVFSRHDLATDGPFVEVQVVVCRNVIIYFDSELQRRVLGLFTKSLCEGGILCLGSHETLRLSRYDTRYEAIDTQQKIYRKLD